MDESKTIGKLKNQILKLVTKQEAARMKLEEATLQLYAIRLESDASKYDRAKLDRARKVVDLCIKMLG